MPLDEFRALADEVYDDGDMFAPIASGSHRFDAMIVAPCSASSLGKIACGLNVPYSELLSRPQVEREALNIADMRPMLEDEGRYRNYLLFPQEAGRRFEVLYIEIDAGGALEAAAHPRGTQEFITVFSGALRVRVDGAELLATEGGALRFAADRPHRYESVGAGTCRLSMVIHYPA